MPLSITLLAAFALAKRIIVINERRTPMAQPTRYAPTYDFSDFQALNPATPLPADKIDEQFNALQVTTDGLCVNIAMIQRDDGALANASVKPETLSTEVLNLIGDPNPRGTWLTATSYAVKDVVSNSGTYICATAHTSGTFATDLAAGKWLLIASTGSSSAAFFQPTGSSAPTDGMYLPAANTIGFSLNSLDVLRLLPTASAQNYLTMKNSAASNALQIAVAGVGTNLDLALVPKGSGSVTATRLTLTNALGVTSGGTGGTTAAAARLALGVDAPEAAIASATTTDLGSLSTRIVSITGTTTITSFGSSASTDTPIYFGRFTGILTLTHNATSLILPGGGDIITAVGDTFITKYEGSGNWRVISYTRAGAETIRLGAQAYAVISNTTYADVTGLTANLEAGAKYAVRLTGHVTCNSAGGWKLDLAGTATFTTFRMYGGLDNGGYNGNYNTGSLGDMFPSITGTTVYYFWAWGFVQANAAGTFKVRFAQHNSNVNASTLGTCSFILEKLP